MLAPPRLAIDRFDVRQFIWEYAIKWVSVFEVVEGAHLPTS